VDGLLCADGPRSHLFFDGPKADFKNFELEVEVMPAAHANSGVYFHTKYQESGFPNKGFEIQVNNTAGGEGSYRERKKTGSLYGLRNVYKQLANDNEWCKLNVLVRGKNIQVRVNGMQVVDYTEPTPPVIPDGMEKERFLDRGTVALQCHDATSKARYRSVRIRPLADTESAGTAPIVDETFRKVIHVGRHNVPMVDLHVHLKLGFTLEQALAKSMRDGIQYGLAINCGKGFAVQDDASARAFLETMKGVPVFIAMQAEGREWTKMFSRQTVALFDYVFTDSMTWTDNAGKRMRTWIPEEVGTISDEQEFMNTLVQRTVTILNEEPIDIYVNPTFVPASIASRYDALWTVERMQKVVEAAARNKVAIELNDRYKLPHVAFVKLAKQAGCKFTFGTNNSSAADLGRCEHGLQMLEECKLVWQDFFVPGLEAKAIDRKPNALRAV